MCRDGRGLGSKLVSFAKGFLNILTFYRLLGWFSKYLRFPFKVKVDYFILHSILFSSFVIFLIFFAMSRKKMHVRSRTDSDSNVYKFKFKRKQKWHTLTHTLLLLTIYFYLHKVHFRPQIVDASRGRAEIIGTAVSNKLQINRWINK